MIFTRREFIKSGASLVAVGSSIPALLMNIASARAAENNQATKDRVFVVFELNGGNDGINTVIPATDPNYPLFRPTLAIPQNQVLMLDDKVGLHPSMTAFHDLFAQKKLAVMQGAGYPDANRSHFRSMEIWHRADPGDTFNTGWLGRYYEQALANNNPGPVPVVHYGQRRPEMFRAGSAPAISIDAVDDFYPLNGKPESVAVSSLYKDMKSGAMDPQGHGSPAVLDPGDVIINTGIDIVRGNQVIKNVLANPRKPKVVYPITYAGKGLTIFAQMIVQNTGTKIFYISLGGFDTHANQAAGHAKLLGDVASSVSAFIADLEAEGRDKDVLVMCFSEFGRRTKENASAGTDHGAASIMFFAGGGIKGGLYGHYPSLGDLQDGDLKYNIDFRDCYATVLENWLGTSSDRILPKHPGRVPFVA
jgi:uncharacterized protein (DUF1501 family)